MKKFISLLEELNVQQQEYLRNELGGDKYKPKNSHKDMFNSYSDKQHPDRIVIPLQSSNLNNKIDPEIKIHLIKHGWNVDNYRDGLASRQVKDRDGNDKLEVRKIGKVLQQTGGDKVYHTQLKDRLIKGSDGKPIYRDGRMVSEKVPQTLSDFYNADPVRDSVKSEHNIVISRDLDDIGGMTSGRNWEMSSCMRLPFGDKLGAGSNHEHIKDDLKKKTLAAYVTKKGDDELENPIARALIKKYKSTKPVNGKTHYIYRPENNNYGDVPHHFSEQLDEITKQHYPAKEGVTYKLDDGLYDNGRSEIEPITIGRKISNGTTKNYNENGELHDYLDEHGVHQSAVNTEWGDYSHYKNGKLHHEGDEPAKIDLGHHYHAINGEYHRTGDKPAIYTNDEQSKLKKYFIGGLLHREGDKPSVEMTDSYSNCSELNYHKAGMLHRDGDKPALIRTDITNHMEHYYRYGKKHRDTDNPSVIETISDGYKAGYHHGYFKDGKQHRDGDLPADISHTNHEHVEQYFKDGELHRDGDKPAYTSTNTGGGMKHVLHDWYTNGNKTKSEKIVHDGDDLYLHETTEYDNDGKITKNKKITPNSIVTKDNTATGNNPMSIEEDERGIGKSYSRQGVLFGLGYEYIPKDGDPEKYIKKYRSIKTFGDNTIVSDTRTPSDAIYHKDNDGIHFLNSKTDTITTLSNNGDLLHSNPDSMLVNRNYIDKLLETHKEMAVKISKNKLPDLSETTNSTLQKAIDNGIDDKHINIIKQFNNAIK